MRKAHVKSILKPLARAVPATLILLGTALAAPTHAASERESLETLRQTTLNLIGVLVEQGVMTREKADALIAAAEKKAAETVAAEKSTEKSAAEKVVADGKAVQPAEGAEVKGRVRVPYVPETVKNEIREQIKQEVLAQARSERWAEPNAIPSWLDSIKWEGDLRVRYQADEPDGTNTPAASYAFLATNPTLGVLTTRAADFGANRNNANNIVPQASNMEDRERLRLRARLGLLAKVSADWSGGVRLASGSTTDRVSTNQTLGTNFNKSSFTLDRAYLKYEPTDWVSVSAGRLPNPWFSTDLLWDEDLNFEGVAASLGRRGGMDTFRPYLTVGAFPLREQDPPKRRGRWLQGTQLGFQWNLSSDTRLKVGAAYYRFWNLEGQRESDDTVDFTGRQVSSSYGQYEYESGLRQKGNTLFLSNAANDTLINGGTNSFVPLWSLASRFHEVNLTAALDLAHFDPVHLTLIGDYVRNNGWNRGEIIGRTGIAEADIPDGRNVGRQIKLQLGMPQIRERHDWNVSLAYRHVGSDAVLDAFTDSDFGLGGTNTMGYQFGINYGLDRNVSLGLKWLSADSIDSVMPSAATIGITAPTRYSVDVFQLEVSARF
jgi:hypothetical protein